MHYYKVVMVSGKEYIVGSKYKSGIEFTTKLYGLDANTPCIGEFTLVDGSYVVIVSTHVQSVEWGTVEMVSYGN